MNNNKFYSLMLVLFMASGGMSLNAQVTIGNTNVPHPGAILDLESNSSSRGGLLMPQVALTSATVWAPLEGSPANGMTVFNTSSSTTDNLKGSGVYVWVEGQWTLASGVGGSSGSGIKTSCAGVTFNVTLQNAPIAACAGTRLSSAIKVVTTGGSGSFSYTGSTDFNSDGSLKTSNINPCIMPTSGPKVLHAKIKDSNNCYINYYFVISEQVSGCPPPGACPAGSYLIPGGVYTPKTTYVSGSSATQATLLSSFNATGKDLCVYSRDARGGFKTWYEAAPDYGRGCNLGGVNSYFIDQVDRDAGWRLPQIVELGQLQANHISYALRDDNVYYWSLTESASTSAWVWGFQSADNKAYSKTKTTTANQLVRCVKSLD